jgi:hypothetical protein
MTKKGADIDLAGVVGKIIDKLFTTGYGKRADYLMQRMPDEKGKVKYAAGWTEQAIMELMKRHLKAHMKTHCARTGCVFSNSFNSKGNKDADNQQ